MPGEVACVLLEARAQRASVQPNVVHHCPCHFGASLILLYMCVCAFATSTPSWCQQVSDVLDGAIARNVPGQVMRASSYTVARCMGKPCVYPRLQTHAFHLTDGCATPAAGHWPRFSPTATGCTVSARRQQLLAASWTQLRTRCCSARHPCACPWLASSRYLYCMRTRSLSLDHTPHQTTTQCSMAPPVCAPPSQRAARSKCSLGGAVVL